MQQNSFDDGKKTASAFPGLAGLERPCRNIGTERNERSVIHRTLDTPDMFPRRTAHGWPVRRGHVLPGRGCGILLIAPEAMIPRTVGLTNRSARRFLPADSSGRGTCTY